MRIQMVLNGKKLEEEIRPDLTLLEFVREHGCFSVKCGCETSGCGLCTVFLDETPVLSCSLPAARADKKEVTTLEGLIKEAEEFGTFLAEQGAEQCGFCNPGMIMNTIALLREKEDPSDEEIKSYLAGNLCRCSGYEGQMRAIKNFLSWRKERPGSLVIRAKTKKQPDAAGEGSESISKETAAAAGTAASIAETGGAV